MAATDAGSPDTDRRLHWTRRDQTLRWTARIWAEVAIVGYLLTRPPCPPRSAARATTGSAWLRWP